MNEEPLDFSDPFRNTPQEIPETLVHAIELQRQGVSDSLEGVLAPLSDEEYTVLRKQALEAIENECSKNPYHNRAHTEGVERRFLELAKLVKLSPCETQIGSIIALFHDYGHIGQTIRQEASSSVPRKDLSNEEFSAVMADHFLTGKVPRDVITFIQSGILATSFGQTSGPYVRPYKPLNAVEKLVAFADIANFTSTPDDWMEVNFNVFREMPFARLAKSFDEMVTETNKFFDYVSLKLEGVSSILGPENTEQLKVGLEKMRDVINSKEIKEKYEPLYEELLAERSQVYLIDQQ